MDKSEDKTMIGVEQAATLAVLILNELEKRGIECGIALTALGMVTVTLCEGGSVEMFVNMTNELNNVFIKQHSYDNIEDEE